MITRLAEQSLAAFGRALWHLKLAPLVWSIGGKSSKVILYHACEPVESDFIAGLDVNTTPAAFSKQLEFFAAHYQVVSTTELERGTIPRRAVAITFDDGYRSVLDGAAPLLAEHGFPATLYLVTDVVDNADMVWVNELNWLLRQRPDSAGRAASAFLGIPATQDVSALVAVVLDRYDRTMVDDLLTQLWMDSPTPREQLVGGSELYVTWEQARELSQASWSLGSHTATHPNLRAVDATELGSEISDSIAEVRRHLGTCDTFAYPFGFTTPEVSHFVEGSGLATIMVVGGSNTPPNPLQVARTSLTATTPAAMFSELEIVGPAKAWAQAVLAMLRKRTSLLKRFVGDRNRPTTFSAPQ